jgi:hypothetical protein
MSSQSERSDDIDIDISSDTEVEKDDKRKTIDFFINDNNEKVFKCKYCSQKYSHKTSKTILKRHYINQHSMTSKQMKMTSFFKTSAPKEPKTFRQCLSDFIISGNHAFNIVEEPEFVQMIRSLSSNIEIPSRFTIKRDIIQLYTDCKTKLIEIFKEMNCNIAITTVIWTSLSNDPYIAITAHFFRNENLCHVLLDFDLIPHPHDGEQIKYTVQCVLENFGIINNIISLTTDNATNNVLGISLFKDYLKQELFIEKEVFHLSCFGHVLNISVQEGIKTIGSALKNLRSLCSAMKTSSKQKQLLEETSIALRQKYYKLKRDNNVRWNSTYVMIERALKLKRVLKSLSCEEKSVFTQNKISDTEWDDLNSILELLKPFYEATFMVSQQSYPSLCVVVPLFDNLLQHLQKQRDNNNLIIKNTAKLMENKLKSYETRLKNDLSYFAVILEPRLNINYFKESQKPEEFAKLKEKFLQVYKINYCNQSFSTSEDTNNRDKTTLTHLPGFFWHAILYKVEGFFENFEKSLLHAILPEV